ncbi:MAG TPA: hypothetical protein VIY51_11460, partial [Xanthobacteraceae bacterium]
MSYVLLAYLAFVVVYQLAKAWHRRKQAQGAIAPPPVTAADAKSAAGAPAAASSTTSSTTEATLAPKPPSLEERLAELERAYEAVGSRAAHPRELAENAQFKEAVSLLTDLDLAVDEVMGYARSTKWGLACAALAALAQRHDGEDAVDQVLAHFPKLVPWAMYFALTYFVEIKSRPPVGAPLVGAQDWWGNVPLMPVIFRDYFVRRAALGDAADFGGTLHSQAASPTPIIKTFLSRVDHPLAAALASKLDTPQHGNIDHAFLTSFGRFWTDQSKAQALVEPDNWKVALATAQSTLQQNPVRSLLISGEQLVGKTSFLRLLAKRLKGLNWSVFEASGA